MRPYAKTLRAVNGKELETEGVIDLEFSFPNNKIKHAVIVCQDAEFSGALLLGKDFLQRASAQIKFFSDRSGCVSIHGINYPFIGTNYDPPTVSVVHASKVEKSFSVGRAPYDLNVDVGAAVFARVKVPLHLNGKTVVVSQSKHLH